MHRRPAPWAGPGSYICRSAGVRGGLIAIRQRRPQSFVAVSHAAAAWETRAPGWIQGQSKNQLQASHTRPHASSRQQDGNRRQARVVAPASPSSHPGNSSLNSSLDWADSQVDAALHEGRPDGYVASLQGRHSGSGTQRSSESLLYHEANHGEGGSCCCDSSGPEEALGSAAEQQDSRLSENCEVPQQVPVAAAGQWEDGHKQPQEQQQQQLQQQQPQQSATAALKQAPGRGVFYFVVSFLAPSVSSAVFSTGRNLGLRCATGWFVHVTLHEVGGSYAALHTTCSSGVLFCCQAFRLRVVAVAGRHRSRNGVGCSQSGAV